MVGLAALGRDTRPPNVGNRHRPKRTAMWLDGVPCVVEGLDEWPKVGDRLVIDGELWRVVAVSDRWVCEREPGRAVRISRIPL